jgi:membrane associated rhomboid family serine protease
MFVAVPGPRSQQRRWAVPFLAAALCLAFVWWLSQPDTARQSLWLNWGALADGSLLNLHDWWPALSDGSALRLLSALFLHADWMHLLGNVVFLLIFGLPAERRLGPWRLLLLFLCGGVVSNAAAMVAVDRPDHIIIGASGAVSALVGTYLVLFPSKRLGVVLPLGVFLEFVRVPAYLLIGVWALLQVVFAYIGPSLGQVAWWAHVAGMLFGCGFALVVRSSVRRRRRQGAGY